VLSVGEVLTEGIAANRLHLILLPTEACNFRCVYCYEDFRLGRMKPEVVEGVERLLESRFPTLDALAVSWFGGEPLAAAEIVTRVMSRVDELRRDRPGLHLSSDMTTNGWLLSEDLFARLFALGVTRYQISFDGPPDLHDRKRLQANGRGSFDGLWSNLLALRDRDEAFTVMVRLHVDRENADRLPEFIARLREDFGGDPRFPLFLKLLSRWGGPRDASLPVFEKHHGEAVTRRLSDQARSLGVPMYDVSGDHGVCYAARANSFVIRADGRVNKCTISLDDPANQVGRLEASGRLILDRDRMLPWMRGLFSGEESALHCPMIGLADGKFRGDATLEPSRFAASR